MQSETEAPETEQRTLGRDETEQKYTCPICGKTFTSPQALRGHMGVHRREKRETGMGVGEGTPGTEADELKELLEKTEVQGSWRPEVESGKPEAPPPLPPPPEVEIIDKAIEFLRERLPQVYGIEKYDRIIINALREDPRPLINPNLLHAFIKSIAPRAHDSHLAVHVINPLYARFPNLPQAVVRYLETTYQPQPYLYMSTPSPYSPYQPLYYPMHFHPYHFYSNFSPYHFYPVVPPYYPPPPPRTPRTYKIVVDGQEIETDEAGYMAWQRFLREREEYERRKQEHELTMKKLEIEIKKALEGGEKSKREEELSKKLDEISKKLEEEREKRHQVEMELLKRRIEELEKRPGLLQELAIYEEIARRLGYHRGGRTVIDLLDSFVERLDQRAAQLLAKIPAPGTEWRPEVKRTPEERVRKAEEIMAKLERTDEILKAEEKLIRAAAKVKPRTVSESGGEKA